MLTENCAFRNLFKEGDFNIRATVVAKRKTRYVTEEAVQNTWREVIRDTLGGGIVNDGLNKYEFTITTENEKFEVVELGYFFLDKVFPKIQESNAVRFDIRKKSSLATSCKLRTWIIFRV